MIARIAFGFLSVGLLASVLATTALAADPSVEELAKQFRSKSSAERIKGIEAAVAAKVDDPDSLRLVFDACLDSSPKVATAALAAVEKLRPNAHKDMVTVVYDRSQGEKFKAIRALADSKEKAVVGILAYFLVADIPTSGKKGTKRIGILSMADALNTLDYFPPDVLGVMVRTAASANADYRTRVQLFATLARHGKTSDEAGKAVLPAFKTAIASEQMLPAIEAAAELGAQAKDLLPVLGALKTDRRKDVRDAATAAYAKIEGTK